MTMNFNETREFQKEFKKLFKKYRSLEGDLEEFKKIIEHFPYNIGKHFHILTDKGDVKIVKARFFCRYLKRLSMRIIYAYHENKNLIEFIEIYFKGNQKNENRKRIEEYLHAK